MDFLIIFSNKPKSDLRNKAIEIANQCDTQIKDGYYHVHFNEINENLKTLLSLSRRWSTSKFIVENGKEDPHKVWDALLCFGYNHCGGDCYHLRMIRYLDLDNLSIKLQRYNSGQWNGDFNTLGLSPLLFQNGLFTKSDDGNQILINKGKIREFIIRVLQIQLKYCDKINNEIIFSKVDALPDAINTVNRNSDNSIPEISRNAIDQNSKIGGFALVAGMNELKDMLNRDVIKPFKNPEKYAKFNVTIPNGILLYGPPGCGKTFIVERLAEELGYNFMKIPASKIGSKYIHQTAVNIANIFQKAKMSAPIILFFDEFEGLVPKREALGESGQYKTEEINEFLQHLNNASQNKILVIGATNQIDLIDVAILRSGRMDKVIFVSPPDIEARKELFRLNLMNKPHSNDINFDKLATKTENYVASDITLIVDNAARKAVDENCELINEQLLLDTIENTPPSVTKFQIEKYPTRGQIKQN